MGSYSELHALGTGSSKLSGDDNLATLGTALHDKSQHTVAGSSDGQTVKKLVSEGLALCDGGETTVLHLLGVELEGVFGELETFLDERGKLTDAATLLTKDLLGVGGTDNDLTHNVIAGCAAHNARGSAPQYERVSHGHHSQSNPPQKAHGPGNR